jgi:hypothetical protein
MNTALRGRVCAGGRGHERGQARQSLLRGGRVLGGVDRGGGQRAGLGLEGSGESDLLGVVERQPSHFVRTDLLAVVVQTPCNQVSKELAVLLI